MNLSLLLIVVCCCYHTHTTTATEIKPEIVQYLLNYGYLESPIYTKHELKKSLRQLQRENNFIVNGRITPEIINLVKYETNKQMVIEYLKTFGYISNTFDPNGLKNAIKNLQRNSGVLTINGIVNDETVNFIKSRPNGYSEPLISKK